MQVGWLTEFFSRSRILLFTAVTWWINMLPKLRNATAAVDLKRPPRRRFNWTTYSIPAWVECRSCAAKTKPRQENIELAPLLVPRRPITSVEWNAGSSAPPELLYGLPALQEMKHEWARGLKLLPTDFNWPPIRLHSSNDTHRAVERGSVQFPSRCNIWLEVSRLSSSVVHANT